MRPLNYDPETGIFTWASQRAQMAAGSVAGFVAWNGYRLINFEGRQHRAHRIAWLFMTGSWPPADIDHINGNRDDNRWINLRAVTRSVNLQNQRRARSHNKLGFLGVQSNHERFMARIKVDGKEIYLGTFDTPELAYAAYLSAKRELRPGNTL